MDDMNSSYHNNAKFNNNYYIFVSFIQNISKVIQSYSLHREHIVLGYKGIFSSRYYSKVVDILQVAFCVFLQFFVSH